MVEMARCTPAKISERIHGAEMLGKGESSGGETEREVGQVGASGDGQSVHVQDLSYRGGKLYKEQVVCAKQHPTDLETLLSVR
jgi:hypothetical protein